MEKNKRHIELYFLIALHCNILCGALYGSIAMLIKSDGALLSMNTDWLKHSPFSTFLIPGIILFFIGVLLPAMSIYGLWRKSEMKSMEAINIFHDKHWGWTFSLYTGITMIIWIAIQQMMTQYFILQPILTLNGVGIIVLTLVPRMIRCFSTTSNG